LDEAIRSDARGQRPGHPLLGRIDLIGADSRSLASAWRAESYPPGTIRALATLLDDLATRQVRYCLWKSNLRLPQALAGVTDVDLLVDRTHSQAFNEVLGRHPVKPIFPPPHAVYPGMEHYLGFDKSDGRLFHLHVHYQMVLGEQFVKNYRVPMEREFLEFTRELGGVPVPSAALELSILSMRALLKYRARDVVKDVLGIRSPGLAEDIHSEIDWLLAQTSVEEVRVALETCGGPVPGDLIGEFLETVERAPRSGYQLFRLRGRLRATVARLQRRGRVQASAEYLGAVWRQRGRFRLHPAPDERMTPAGGGLILALVGADGSGKSTLSGSLATWLGWKLEASVFYMGSKQPSRISSWLYLAFRAQRRGHRNLEALGRPAAWMCRPLGATRDLTLALHHLSIGRDRTRRYRAARRAAVAGSIVIFDRFPFERLSREPRARLLDGPQIAASVGGLGNRAIRALAAREERMYECFELPEYLLALQVSPEVSALRKPDHAPEIVAAKAREVLELAALAATSGAEVWSIDADRPLHEVTLEAKRRLWDVL
jgi:hypothetical protein